MNSLKKNNGLALLDLLGAIVIMGLVSILVINLISVIYRSQESIIVQEDKSTTGLFLVREIENTITEFKPTEVSYCDLTQTCITLLKSSENIYDSITGEVTETIYNPPLEMTILFDSTNLSIDAVNLSKSYFQIDVTTYFEIANKINSVDIIFHISLADKYDQIDEFVAFYSIPI